MNGKRYRLTLQAVPDQVPVILRLRQALKTLLRAYGFRCENVEELASRRQRIPATVKALKAAPAQRTLF